MDQQPPPPLPPAGYAPPPHPHAAAMAPFPGEAEAPWEAYHTGAEAPTQPSQRRLPAQPITARARASAAAGGGRPSLSKKGDGNASWEERFTQLALWKAQKGSCDVPVKDDAQLGRWVRTQRNEYRKRADGKPSTMNDERVELLDSIAFDWKLNAGRRQSAPRAKHRSWDEWLEELRSYHATHGHSNVPQKDPSGLGLWVSKQRQNWKAWMNGEPSPMTRERIAALEELGFQFESLVPPRTPWEDRLEELKQYKAEHGNCRVRAGKVREGTFSSLGKWVDRQRQMYKLRNQGKKTALTDDRVSALEEVGFEWAVPRGKEPANPRPQGQAIAAAAAAGHQSIMTASPASRGRPKKADGVVGVGSPTGTLRKTQAQKWNERYEQLKQYRAETGSTRVRAGKSKDDSYSKLGKWCDHQRQLYRLRRDGKPSSMSDERIRALEDVGFQWVLQHRVEDRGVVGPLMQPTTTRTPLPPRTARQMEQQKEAILSNGKKQSQKWYDNYEELRCYREEHGNCRVKAGKKKDSSYSKLGKWVDHQRQLYRLRAQGKPTSLSDERIAALDEIGFEWVVVKRTGGGRPVEEPHDVQAHPGAVEDSEAMQAQQAAAAAEAAAALEDNEEMAGEGHVSI